MPSATDGGMGPWRKARNNDQHFVTASDRALGVNRDKCTDPKSH
jgi:hypothetical protein